MGNDFTVFTEPKCEIFRKCIINQTRIGGSEVGVNMKYEVSSFNVIINKFC